MARTDQAGARRIYYTVESANRALPLVRNIIRDVLSQWQVVSELERRLAPLCHGARPDGSANPYSEELACQRRELEAEQERFRAYLCELDRLGIELKSVETGLCDFPSLRDGREVCLCWKLGEPAVEFWHEVDTGFAGRRPVTPDPEPFAQLASR